MLFPGTVVIDNAFIFAFLIDLYASVITANHALQCTAECRITSIVSRTRKHVTLCAITDRVFVTGDVIGAIIFSLTIDRDTEIVLADVMGGGDTTI